MSFKLKVNFKFFSAPAGSVYEMVPNCYMSAICDGCGTKKKCDYFVWRGKEEYQRVFLDLCRTCQKRYGEMVE